MQLESSLASFAIPTSIRIVESIFDSMKGKSVPADSSLPSVFEFIVRNRQTIAIGDLLTLDTIAAPAPGYTGPVDVVLGENDMAFCRGDCTTPTDQSAAVQPVLYPNAGAGSSHFLVPGAGHLIYAHFGARAAWDHQLNFLKANGL